MVKFIKLNLLIGVVLFFSSCGDKRTSMFPTEVIDSLPTLTKSNFISQSQVAKAVKTNSCKYLIKGRKYTAPMGSTVKGDLKYGAKGIDEWVELDGGNAYVLKSFKWEIVADNGSTQLLLEFDTMLCE